jgi:hypothetical protein
MAQEFIHQLHITGPETNETFTLSAGLATLGRQGGNARRLTISSSRGSTP